MEYAELGRYAEVMRVHMRTPIPISSFGQLFAFSMHRSPLRCSGFELIAKRRDNLDNEDLFRFEIPSEKLIALNQIQSQPSREKKIPLIFLFLATLEGNGSDIADRFPFDSNHERQIFAKTKQIFDDLFKTLSLVFSKASSAHNKAAARAIIQGELHNKFLENLMWLLRPSRTNSDLKQTLLSSPSRANIHACLTKWWAAECQKRASK
eukprot:TRINITY_DN6263_c0_g1_i1.p1 TRINITY_DN6263_c0_g1~~TRINITY_DN6263_c0_g1_i1.p1  ORF type:complete len:243 (-),score=27.06 TRINITY_DN6263_c0_g1_i1:4-627(-)